MSGLIFEENKKYEQPCYVQQPRGDGTGKTDERKVMVTFSELAPMNVITDPEASEDEKADILLAKLKKAIERWDITDAGGNLIEPTDENKSKVLNVVYIHNGIYNGWLEVSTAVKTVKNSRRGSGKARK